MEKPIIEYKDQYFYLDAIYYDKIGKIGKLENNKIILTYEEVLYILYKGWSYVKINEKIYKNYPEFLKDNIKNINMKEFLVLKYLRDIGYRFIKDKYLFFFIENKKYLVYPFLEYEEYKIEDIYNIYIKASREYNSKLLLAIIDSENSIVFYEINEIKI